MSLPIGVTELSCTSFYGQHRRARSYRMGRRLYSTIPIPADKKPHAALDQFTLASSDPFNQPIIDINFNATEADRYILREGIKKAVSVVAETESEQSFIDDEVVPDGYTAMLPGSAEKTSTSALETSGPGPAIHTRYRQSRRFQLQGYRRAIPAGHKCKLFPIPIAAHPQVCVYTVAEKAV